MKNKKIYIKEHLFFLLMAFSLLLLISAFFFWVKLSAEPILPTALSVSESSKDAWKCYTQEGDTVRYLTPSSDKSNVFAGLAEPGQTFYLTRLLPETVLGSPILHIVFASSKGSIRYTLFLDGSPFYSDLDAENPEIGKLQYPPLEEGGIGASVNEYISLPEGYEGKLLTIGLQFIPKDPTETNVRVPQLYLYDNIMSLWSEPVSDAVNHAFPAGMLTVVGLCLLVLFLFQCWQHHPDWGILLMALTAFLSSCFYTLSYSKVFLLVRSPLFNWMLGSLTFIPVFFFLAIRMRKMRKWYLAFPIIYSAALIIVSIIWIISGSAGSFEINLVQKWLTNLSFFAALICGTVEYFQKNTFYRSFSLWLGIALAAFLAVWGVSSLTNGDFAAYLSQKWLPVMNTGMLSPLIRAFSILLLAASLGIGSAQFVRFYSRQKSAIQSLELKSNFAMESANQMRDSMEHTWRARHELLHHVEAMRALCEKEEYSRLNNYLDTLTKQAKAAPPLLYCENLLINAIVANWIAKAAQHEIQTAYTVSVPETLSMQDTDLSSFLTNLLENAVEAASAVCPSEKRFIHLKISLNNENFLFVSCENSWIGSIHTDELGNPVSGKPEDGHGYGIALMQRIAEKYGSILCINYNNTVFTVKTNLLTTAK